MLAHALLELAGVFLRLGCTGFGGPAAHLALMEHELVRRRRWLSHQELLDLWAAAQLMPGPNSTELAIHIGQRRAGFAGLLVAGVCFILPATLLTLLAAWAYVRFGALPTVGHVLRGIQPVIVAIVAQALVGLGRSALRSAPLVAVALAAAVADAAGVDALAVLALAGAAAVLEHAAAGGRARLSALVPATVASAGAPGAAAAFGLGPLFLAFLKIGAVLFGSGYVLLAFLRADLVEHRHWLTEGQLLDAIAVGQLTPGPVFSAATFLGYLLAGTPGAAVATAGIFLPAFAFVAVSGPLVPRLRRSPAAGAFLDGVIAASLGLMAVVTWHLARAALVDVPTLAIAVAALVALVRFRVNPAWLVLAGAVLGALVGARG